MLLEKPYAITYIDGRGAVFYPVRVIDVGGNVVPFVVDEGEARRLVEALSAALPIPYRLVVKESGVS